LSSFLVQSEYRLEMIGQITCPRLIIRIVVLRGSSAIAQSSMITANTK